MVKPISLYKRPGDLVIVLFFTFHIPITVLFASQVVLGRSFSSLVPSWASNLLSLAAKSSNDPLLSMALPVVKREPWAISIFLQNCWDWYQ